MVSHSETGFVVELDFDSALGEGALGESVVEGGTPEVTLEFDCELVFEILFMALLWLA